jgi:NAD(P)-dependent dehydrogenase (short-subunit alcohol dehydrogenase family)
MSETLLMVGVRTLGRAVAEHFGKAGWRVVCASRTLADVEAAAAEVTSAGGQGVAAVADLSDRASLDRLVATAGRIDLCVASQNAGGRFGALPLLEIPDEELDRGYAAYLRGTWNLLKAVGPVLLAQKSGTFIQMGTASGVRTRDGFAALGAVQHGLRALVQVAAREWRRGGVHVAYVPVDGPIASERTREWLARSPTGTDGAVSQDAIARACEYLHRQDRQGWTHELVLRPIATDWTAPT